MPDSRLSPLVLDAAEVDQLKAWARRPKTAQALALRSRIVLRCAADQGIDTNSVIAQELGIGRGTVAKWRARFLAERLDGLLDEPRPGRPRTVTDAQVEEVITTTLESTPRDATHWSTRSLAAELGLSQSAVSRIWRAFGLQPHRQDTWKLSKDPLFIDKVRDVVGLYLDPPERAVVLCVDEKSQIQALDRTAPILPMLPGTPQRATHDYIAAGTSSLYAALDLATGKVIGSLHARHRAIEFKKFLHHHRPRGPRPTSTCTWSWTTPRPTRPPRSNAGWPPTPGSPCTSPRPVELLAQPGRTLVRRADHQEAATRHPPQRPRPQHRHPRLDQDLERQPPALRLDQDRRPDPRIHRPLLHAD